MNTQPCSGKDISADRPAAYRIRVQGHIKASWLDRFEDMAIDVTPPAQQPAVTTLSGMVSDQAALVGMLNSLYALHLVVLSVECLDAE
jgi:hypothetical protein